jgi:hypothetical protein
VAAEPRWHGMRMRRALLAIFAVSLAALALVAAFSMGAAGHDVDEPSSVLFTQSAAAGSLKPAGGDRMTLTLRGVAPQVVWFQDRPNRHAGHVSAAALVSQWRSFGFQSDAPNAALTLLGAPDEADTVVVELRRPRYNPAQGTMTYVVRLLSQTPNRLDDFGADATVPATFGAASLFIDDAQVDGGTIANIERRAAFLAAAEAEQVEMRHLREEDSRPPR